MDSLNAAFNADYSMVGQFVQSTMNDRFAMIAMLTFFVCEAVFNMLPIEQARSKQATSLVVGGLLGLLLLQTSILDAILQGILAGGATTMLVAKFKKPSTVAVPTPAESAPATAITIPTPPSSSNPMPAEAPVEHL